MLNEIKVLMKLTASDLGVDGAVLCQNVIALLFQWHYL